jgi:chemotaxis methyl-accepting protein methylase
MTMLRLQMPRKSPIGVYLRLNKRVWKRLPSRFLNSALIFSYGTFLQKLVRRRSNRRQYFGTFFLRNRPQLELMRRLVELNPSGSNLRIAVVGCSIGAEVYRRERPAEGPGYGWMMSSTRMPEGGAA